MKQRLLFFALAFLGLGFLAYILRPADMNVPNTWASGAPSRAMPQPPPIKPANETASSVKPGKAVTADGRKPSTDGPETEAAAVGYLQSQSTKAWTLKRDDFTPTIRTLTNGELSSDTKPPREAADAFVKFYSKGLFGVDPARVQFAREEVTDRTRLIYNEVIDGTPVYGASLTLFFENGALTRVQNDLAQGEVDSASKAVAVNDAFASYKALSKVDVELQENSRTVLVPRGRSLAYAYELSTKENGHSFHVVYDETNQFIIQRKSSEIH